METSLSVQEFSEYLERRLKAMSASDMKDWIRRAAAQVPPEERAQFLTTLQQDKTPRKETSTDLLHAIDTLRAKVEKALKEEPTWDMDHDDETPGLDEFHPALKRLIGEAREVFVAKNYTLASEAYARLFTLMSLEDEYGRCTGFPYDLDQDEEQARYLRSIIELETAERARLLLMAWARIRRGNGIRLDSIFKITPDVFPEQNQLLDELIPLLEAQADETCDAWLRQAILLRQGTGGLEVLAERSGNRRPQVWVEWVAEIARERTPQEVLAAAAKAFQHLPERHSLRADVAAHAFTAAKQLNDEGSALQARWEGVCSARSEEAVLDLWNLLPDVDQRRHWMQRAVEELCTPTPKVAPSERRFRPGGSIPRTEQDWPFDEDDGNYDFGPGSYSSFREATRNTIALARLLAGDWQAAWSEARKEQVLGWSGHDTCQALVVASFLARFARTTLETPLPPAIEALYRSTLGVSALDVLRETHDRGAHIRKALDLSMAYWAPNFDTGMQAVNLVIKRVDAIVDGLHRNAYARAALALCAAVEAMTCLGKDVEGRALMQEVIARHKRKSAFTRALRELQAQLAKSQRT